MAFSFDNLRKAPFYLATLTVAFIGFFLALIGTAIAQAGPYSWLTIVYTLLQILAVGYCVGSGVLPLYRLAILTCLAVNIMLALNGANTFIYGGSSSIALVGAGFTFVALIELIWAIVIGSEDSSYVYYLVDSTVALAPTSLHATSAPSHAYPMNVMAGGASSAGAPGVGVPIAAPAGHSVVTMPSPSMSAGIGAVSPTSPPGVPAHSTAVTSTVSDVQYLYKARAKYAYTANPEDNTELSFAKDEVLDIADNKGKWWHARKADGSIGVVPSNYLDLLGPANNA